ncbi:polysaccharide deacetylase [Hydrogenophaga sp. PAMC20947]|nr:polysaccharide deacetylase [Hydrogenophaga sp. PAMC20947]
MANRVPAQMERPFRRYDYAEEWNNLGYGAITADGTCWSIAQHATAQSENQLAQVHLGEALLCSFAALWDRPASSVLWFNRAAGPIDSQEWRIVEDFLSCHRHKELPCEPVLSEVPHGFDSAVTMRLDCDENIESARALWELYRSEAVPFSLALHARVLTDERHHRLPCEVLAEGGAILSHTATHAPNWGGNHEAAFHEGQTSAAVIESAIGCRVRYAVSPFHQTPAYARLGLADAGYQGCIGGIICNDPDFLTARAGIPPASGMGFIGHSQQCMLHGDCMLAEGDPLRSFRQAFDIARTGGAFFGYLDHPFSERYTYGWLNEEQRLQAHKDLIAHIKTAGGRILWANEDDAMDFLFDRAHTAVMSLDGSYRIKRTVQNSSWPLSVRHRGQHICIEQEGLLP